ncbi:MAG: RepB family plasmid replication initiator protein [Candidatus Nanopelagicales bacterium]
MIESETVVNHKELVVMSNNLIEASYKLTLVEQQIVLYAICRCREAQQTMTADTVITIRAIDFATQFGTHPDEVYRQLKTALSTLYERSVKVTDRDPLTGRRRTATHRWISSKYQVEGDTEKGAGTVQLQFTPFIIPFITRLESAFTSYALDQVAKMTSIHAIRMYALLVQYGTIKKREMALPWLRHTLQLEQQYPAIKDFKKWVLDIAVAQINAFSDLTVSYTQHKTGRIVSHFIFEIKAKAKPRLLAGSRRASQAEC